MKKEDQGFTLIEVLIGTALFLVIGIAVYGAFASLIKLANANQARILGVELADEQFEIIRNMPYVNVGLTNGIPQGVLPQTQTLSRGGFTFTVTLVIRNLSLATSSLQASSKLVEVDVTCASCQQSFPTIALTGQVSPANLQSAASGGAVIVNVIDSNGNPVQGATVTLQSTATSSVTDTDVTNSSGVLEVIGVPPGNGIYHITTTKTGYSSAAANPDQNVLQGQLTTVTLKINQLSTLAISSVSPTCSIAPSFHFHLTGASQYSQDQSTNGSGVLTLSSMVPDTYTLTPTDASRDAAGITPFSPLALNPGSTQALQLVVVPANENSLMVVVETTSGQPISGATVELSNTSGYDKTLVTGQGYFEQSDWSHGATQSGTYTDSSAYAYGSGVDTSTSSGNVVMSASPLDGTYSTYAPGILESSTFDTGTTSNFYALKWAPTSQVAPTGPTPIGFQFATASSSLPEGSWTYLGPDGSQSSYYTSSGAQIYVGQNGNEFARYLMYLSTATATATPYVNDVSFSYTSGCLPPGQVLFQGLSAGSSYTLIVSDAGYSSQTVSPVTISSGWQSQSVPMSP